MKTVIPKNYRPKLGLYDTQMAIGALKRVFESELCSKLNLKRVSAPLFLESGSGLNDDLNGVERPVEFDVRGGEKQLQIVHSLAKWKRLALWKYGFKPGEGLYTDMNAIRRDEEADNLHSFYVDQWDWEKVIVKEDRNERYLKETVRAIYGAIVETSARLKKIFPALTDKYSDDITFITTSELEMKYPYLTPKQRENAVCREYGSVFLMQIGGKLSNGLPHDGRAPDYDDWKLNGDIIVYNRLLDCAFELSSMGIRVDEKSLVFQLDERGVSDRKNLYFHKLLLEGKLPLSIGGGIGQSRLSMLLLEKAHIGEVQVSVWDEQTIEACKNSGVTLL